MAAVTSPARHAASLATSASNREPRRSKVHRAMEWLKPSSAPSSVTMSASVRARMQTPSCTSYQLGSLTTTRFTRTRHSDIVHPVSSSQLTETRDHVRSFGGYNTIPILEPKGLALVVTHVSGQRLGRLLRTAAGIDMQTLGQHPKFAARIPVDGEP